VVRTNKRTSPVRGRREHCSASRARVTLHNTSALLMPGTQSRPQVTQSVLRTFPPPSHPPFTQNLSAHTIPAGLLAEGRRTHTIHALTAKNCHEHVHTCTYSVLAVPWHNARRWLLGMAYGPNQRPVPSGMKQALTHLWTVELACQQDNFTSFRVMLMIFFGALGCTT